VITAWNYAAQILERFGDAVPEWVVDMTAEG
jgi:hypothetical protein